MPVIIRRIESNYSRLSDVIPEFDRDSEVIFFVHPGSGHGSLFFGDHLFDYHVGHGYRNRRDPKAIFEGVAVRVMVGREAVERMNRSMENRSYEGIEAPSCHHTQTIFLQQNGILVRGFIPILGSSLWARILKEGFENEAGVPFRQIIYDVRIHDRDGLESTLDAVKQYQLTQSFFLDAFVRKAEVIEGLRNLTRGTRWEGGVEAIANGTPSDEGSKVILLVMESFEAKLLSHIRGEGHSPREIVERYSTNKAAFPKDSLRETVQQLLKEAAIEVMKL